MDAWIAFLPRNQYCSKLECLVQWMTAAVARKNWQVGSRRNSNFSNNHIQVLAVPDLIRLAGTFTMPSAMFFHIFYSTHGTRVNSGNASTAMDTESGLNETYFSICLINLEANKSISGLNSSCLVTSSKIILLSIHSVLSSRNLDFFLSASVLKNPGTWVAVVQFFVDWAHTETMALILFVADMADVLSI